MSPRADTLLTASVAIAAQDVALRRWAADGSRSLSAYVDETFAALADVIDPSPARWASATKHPGSA